MTDQPTNTTPKRWYCRGASKSCPPPRPCLGHTITPLIRQQAETLAWVDGWDWIHLVRDTRQEYLNDAGQFVTRRATA